MANATCRSVPLSNASSSRGAQMGRPSNYPHNPNSPVRLSLERLRLVDGDYDTGGAYWGGGGEPMYRAVGEGGVELFVRAKSRQQAKAAINARIPGARFYR